MWSRLSRYNLVSKSQIIHGTLRASEMNHFLLTLRVISVHTEVITTHGVWCGRAEQLASLKIDFCKFQPLRVSSLLVSHSMGHLSSTSHTEGHADNSTTLDDKVQIINSLQMRHTSFHPVIQLFLSRLL